MQTILFVATDYKTAEKAAEAFCEARQISRFDQTMIIPEEDAQSLGIKSIKKMQELLYLAPSQGKEKAVIIPHAELLTSEAQNALLKTLEEPPRSTYIILIAPSVKTFLPTVLSRCSIKTTQEKTMIVIDKDKYKMLLQQFIHAPVGQRLKIAQEYGKNKDMAKLLTETMVIIISDSIRTNPNQEALLSLAQRLHQATMLLSSTNTNPRILLENLLLTNADTSFDTESTS